MPLSDAYQLDGFPPGCCFSEPPSCFQNCQEYSLMSGEISWQFASRSVFVYRWCYHSKIVMNGTIRWGRQPIKYRGISPIACGTLVFSVLIFLYGCRYRLIVEVNLRVRVENLLSE